MEHWPLTCRMHPQGAQLTSIAPIERSGIHSLVSFYLFFFFPPVGKVSSRSSWSVDSLLSSWMLKVILNLVSLTM